MDIIYFVGFNFIIYSFLGWIIEELYCVFINKSFKKDGFLKGPIKPMYGIAMTTLVLCFYLYKMNRVSMMILCFFVPSLVEYISGYLLNHIFNKHYWSYADLKFNVEGYVSLKFSLYWMLLSFIGIYYFQPLLDSIYISFNEVVLKAIIFILELFILLDVVFTIKLYGLNLSTKSKE